MPHHRATRQPGPTPFRCHALISLALGLTLAPGMALAQDTSKSPEAPEGNWSVVDQALGRKGAPQPGGVMKYSIPRSDLQVTAGGVRLKPAFALGGWIAFKNVAGEAMMMGDLVLTEDEVGPVMRALQQNGVEETALHNHVLKESPQVMYMHVHGQGDPAKLALAVRNALAQSNTQLQ